MHRFHPVSGRALSSRGELLRTFGSLAGFVAFLLLALGGYLVEDQLANPVQAHEATLLFAALAISASLILLYGLLYEAARNRFRSTPRSSRAARPKAEITVIPRRDTLRLPLPQEKPFFYDVDRARIRPSAQARGMAGK